MTTENSWRKSSHSVNDANCVEVCGTLDRLRDSKDPAGRTLRADVPAMVRAFRAGRIHR